MMEEIPQENNLSIHKPLLARLNIGLVGVSQTTQAVQQFRLDHILAQEAVLTELPSLPFFIEHWYPQIHIPLYFLHTQATSKEKYILQPALGRRLDEQSKQEVHRIAHLHAHQYCIVIADGLSVGAVLKNGLAFLIALLQNFREKKILQPSAVFIVRYGRVAIADEIGEILNAKLSIIAIGERPGLRNLDSMSVYLTPSPTINSTDAIRSCISNIHSLGLSPEIAAQKVQEWL